jgi:peroxiredoxin
MATLKAGDKAPGFNGINQEGKKIDLNDFSKKKYMGVLRTIFVIDEKGIIQEVFEKVKTRDHTNQIISKLKI